MLLFLRNTFFRRKNLQKFLKSHIMHKAVFSAQNFNYFSCFVIAAVINAYYLIPAAFSHKHTAFCCTSYKLFCIFAVFFDWNYYVNVRIRFIPQNKPNKAFTATYNADNGKNYKRKIFNSFKHKNHPDIIYDFYESVVNKQKPMR